MIYKFLLILFILFSSCSKKKYNYSNSSDTNQINLFTSNLVNSKQNNTLDFLSFCFFSDNISVDSLYNVIDYLYSINYWRTCKL